jgi:ABC-type nitrate/sulfonate/bicarbonate transport system permease component
MSLHWLVRDLLEPWVAALYTVPIIAIGPLFIIWLGIGLTSKIVIVFLVAVFPVILSTLVGLNQVEPHLVEAVRSFGATSLDIYTKVRLPAAIPSILTGFRIALRGALVAVVVAELFGSKAGLGQMILSYSQSFETAKVFVGVLSLSGLGIVGFMLLRLIERFLTPWQQQRTGA